MDSARYSKLVKLFHAPVAPAVALVAILLCPSRAQAQENRIVQKRIIGPTTIIAEADSELDFKARVDTGATTTSMHVEEWSIEDESPEMVDNLGKKIRIRIKNHRDESQWIESRIEEIGTVKTSEQAEQRYKVALTLCWSDMKKSVLVTLNDRSHMKYPMLIGRNFLEGDFVVDVDLKKHSKAEILQMVEDPTEEEPEAAATTPSEKLMAENNNDTETL